MGTIRIQIGTSTPDKEQMHTLESISGTEEAKCLLASIVESSKDSIITANFEGIITSWNKAAESLYGYSAAEAAKAYSLAVLNIQ